METLKFIAGRSGIALTVALAMVVGTVALAGAASAQTTDPVEGAFADMSDKVTLYGGLIVGLVVLSVALFLGIKYLRKGVSKA